MTMSIKHGTRHYLSMLLLSVDNKDVRHILCESCATGNVLWTNTVYVFVYTCLYVHVCFHMFVYMFISLISAFKP